VVHELEPELIITIMHGQQHIKTHQNTRWSVFTARYGLYI